MKLPVGTSAVPVEIEDATQFLIINSSGGPVVIDYDADVTPDTGFIVFSSNQLRVPASRAGVPLHVVSEYEDYEIRVLPIG